MEIWSLSSKYKLAVELCAGYFTSGSHTYLTGILRSTCTMGKMPGIPLSLEPEHSLQQGPRGLSHCPSYLP